MSKNKEIETISEKAVEEQNRFSVNIKEENGTNKMDCQISKNLLSQITGIANRHGADKIFQNTLAGLITGGYSPEELEIKVEQLFMIMAELNPLDGFEGMLISQMITVYDQAMDCFKYVNLNRSNTEACQRLQNQAMKLMRIYSLQLETLDKHRNKGKQKMTVEHVHIHKGAQAIVGNVNQGGGVNNEN